MPRNSVIWDTHSVALHSGYSHSIVVFGSTVDQNQVRLDLAITAIVQRADHGVIDSIGPIPYS
nr:hypothetical protein [Chlorobium phaeobacteroides]